MQTSNKITTMIGYKLTNQNMCTYNNTQWEIGIPKSTNGKGKLCSNGWLHFYDSKLLAILFNPLHANIQNPKIFKCKATGNHLNDNGLKRGSTTLELIKEIKLPQLNTSQITAFGILCSLEVYKENTYTRWAKNWLLNKDRSAESAWSAAKSVTWSAAWSATKSIWSAAESATWSAESAAKSAAKSAWSAAESATWSAARSARSAARSARSAESINKLINFKKLANECLQY